MKQIFNFLLIKIDHSELPEQLSGARHATFMCFIHQMVHFKQNILSTLLCSKLYWFDYRVIFFQLASRACFTVRGLLRNAYGDPKFLLHQLLLCSVWLTLVASCRCMHAYALYCFCQLFHTFAVFSFAKVPVVVTHGNCRMIVIPRSVISTLSDVTRAVYRVHGCQLGDLWRYDTSLDLSSVTFRAHWSVWMVDVRSEP